MMQAILWPLCIISALISFSSALLQEIPGLYLDKVTLWSTSGASHGQISGGYNFSLSWRNTLPGVRSTALGLYNFQTGGGKILNFNAQLSSVTTSSSRINVKPLGSNAGIVYLAFSIVVITADNNYTQLLTVTKSGLYTYGQFTKSFSVYSSKFTFGSSTHQVNNFIQWITTPGGTCGSAQWYWVMLDLETVSGTSQIKVPYYIDNDLESVKMNILIIAKQTSSFHVNVYSTYSQNGIFKYSTIDHLSSRFSNNLGIDTALFGNPDSGQRCLHGLTYIFLFCNIGESSRANKCLFNTSSGNITSFSYSRAEVLKVNTICIGRCPAGTFYNLTSYSCDSCNQGCSSCDQCGNCTANSTVVGSTCSSNQNSTTPQTNTTNSTTPQTNTTNSTTSQTNSTANATVSEDIQSSSTSIVAAIGITIFIIVVIVIIVLVYRKCKRQEASDINNRPNDSNYNIYVVNAVNAWKNIHITEMDDSMCPICLCDKNGLQTACGHLYHVQCILEWSKKKKECGLCRQSLTGKLHKIFCIKCRQNYRSIQYRQIEQLYQRGQVNAVAICSDCKYRTSK